jgi:hypothetical protein
MELLVRVEAMIELLGASLLSLSLAKGRVYSVAMGNAAAAQLPWTMVVLEVRRAPKKKGRERRERKLASERNR